MFLFNKDKDNFDFGSLLMFTFLSCMPHMDNANLPPFPTSTLLCFVLSSWLGQCFLVEDPFLSIS